MALTIARLRWSFSDMRIKREYTAALVVDFQERLVPVVADSRELMERVQVLLRGLRLLQIPMLVTQQYTKGLGMSVPEIREASGEMDYAEKSSFSGLAAADPFIHGKKYILVCGIEAHCCVLQTVIDLAAAGYIPVLVTDCVGSRRMEDRRIAIERARQEGAILTTSEAILFELLGTADTPIWKELLKIVK